MTAFRNGIIARALQRRSLRAIVSVERNIGIIAGLWAFVVTLAVLFRLSANGVAMSLPGLAAHTFLIFSPAVGIMAAALLFPAHTLMAVPDIALARVGRWARVDPVTARDHRSFGAGGLMAGLAIGLLMNIAMRTGEFLLGVPAIASVGPAWARMLFFAMAADCVLFNLLYAAAFMMAVRNVPWFPRMLVLIWAMDIVSQLVIAQLLGSVVLPGKVASALGMVLTVNCQKTLISMTLWLPYLLLSERVNITYRRRVRA